MDAATGRELAGVDHLRQSIRDILTTPLGTRTMRESYGSRLFQLIDAPMNRATLLDLYAATVEAITRWEPRFKVSKVEATSAAPGAVTLAITGEYLPDGVTVTLDGIVVS